MVKSILLIPAFFIFLSAGAQVTAHRYQKDFWAGGIITSRSCAPAKDSGLYVLSTVDSLSFGYWMITRLDKRGNIIWNQYLQSGDPLWLTSSICTYDNGVILYGHHNPLNGMLRPLIFKIDSAGNQVWSKFYPSLDGGIGSVNELADSSLALSIAYYTNNIQNYLLQRIDPNCNIIWTKKTDFHASSIRQKTNSNLIICGNNLQLKEFSINGNEVGQKQYFNTGYFFNGWVFDINFADELLILSDAQPVNGSFGNLYALRIDAAGNVIFSNNYSGDWIYAQTYAGYFTPDCGMVLNSRFKYQNTDNKHGIMKLDSSGNSQWLKVYDFAEDIYPTDLSLMPDYGYASIGTGSGNMFARIVKTDLNGETPCNNDTNITPTITNVPLIVDATLYTDAFINLSNVDSSVVQISVTPSFTDHCRDSLSFPSIMECWPCPPPQPQITGNSIFILGSDSLTLGLSYSYASYCWQPGGQITPAITVSPTVTTTYTVNVTNICGTDSATFTVNVFSDDCMNAIFIPNAFSPNNDGQNDVLRILYVPTICLNTFEIAIYNRWGEMVFKSTDPDFRWDGTYKGQKLFSQVLNYYIITKDDKEITHIKKGNISIVL